MFFFHFFFSSRRRHTRSLCDWSSDVCSSDLAGAAWDGWNEVQRLLLGAPWLDRQLGGEGRELVARSLLESGERAVSDARLAMESAPDEATKQSREVLLARAHDRANARDSAAF